MISETNVAADALPEEGSAGPIMAEPAVTQQQAEPGPAQSPSSPRPSATRARAELGHAAVAAVRAVGATIAGAARIGASAARWMWHVAETVPPAVRGAGFAAVVALLGVVGAIALQNTVGLVCIVVVVPVASSVLGALAHGWYSRVTAQPRTSTDAIDPSASELRRSVDYVDNKLALALTSLGTDRHQQAVVALFQAKTAVELTLGTERESQSYDVALRADDYGLSPRGGAGSKATSALRENNSLAAS